MIAKLSQSTRNNHHTVLVFDFLHPRNWYSQCHFLQMDLTNLPRIQYTERLAESLTDHRHAILPWRSWQVRMDCSVAKLLQYVDEHILVKGKLRRHCVLCSEKKEKKNFVYQKCNLPNVYVLFHTISHLKRWNKATFVKTKCYLSENAFFDISCDCVSSIL